MAVVEIPEEKLKKVYNWVLDQIRRAEESRETPNERCIRWYRLWRSWMPKELRRARRSNLVIPKVFSLVETICPIDVGALLSVSPPIQVVPRSGDDVEGAPLWEMAIDKYLEDARLFWALVNADKAKVIYGDSFIKVSWSKHSRTGTYRVPVFANLGGTEVPIGTTTETREVVHYDGISLDAIDPWYMLVAPGVKEVVKDGRPAELIGDKSYYPHSRIMELARQGVFDKENVEKNLKKGGFHATDNKWHREKVGSIGLTDYTQMGKEKMPEVAEVWFMYDLNEDGKYQHFVMNLINRNYPPARFQLNPFWHSVSPYVHFKHIVDPNEFWGIGAVEAVEKIAQEISASRNIYLDNKNLLTNVAWKKKPNIDARQLISAPAQIINVMDMDDVEMVTPPALSPDVYQSQVIMDRDFDEAAGIGAWKRGLQPMKVSTATEASYIEAATDAKAKSSIMLMEQGALPLIGLLSRKLIEQFGTNDIMLRITGKAGGYEFRKTSPYELALYGEMDFKCIGSQSFSNKGMRATQLMNLIKIIWSNPALMIHGNAYSFLKDILVLMDIKDYENKIWKPEIVQILERLQAELTAQKGQGGTGVKGNEMEQKQISSDQELIRNLQRQVRPEELPNLVGAER